MSGTAYVDNDNLLWVRGAVKARDGTQITAGIGHLTTILDRRGVAVPGQVFPTILFYTGTAGDWVAQIDDELELHAGDIYTAVVDLDAGGGLKGHWEIPFMAKRRRH